MRRRGAIETASKWIERFYLTGQKVILTLHRPDDPNYPADMPEGLETPLRSNAATLRLGEVLIRDGREVRFAYPDESSEAIDQWMNPPEVE